MDNLYKVTVKDIPYLSQMCAEAFADDNLHNYLLGSTEDKMEKLKLLHEINLRGGIAKGNVYATSPNLEGVIVWYTKDTGVLYYIFNGGFKLMSKLGLGIILRFIKYKVYSDRVRNSITKDRYAYLELLAVDKTCQGKGFGSKLMRAFLDNCTEEGRQAILETHEKINVDIYTHLGFMETEHSYGNNIPKTRVRHYSMSTN